MLVFFSGSALTHIQTLHWETAKGQSIYMPTLSYAEHPEHPSGALPDSQRSKEEVGDCQDDPVWDSQELVGSCPRESPNHSTCKVVMLWKWIK